MGKLTISTGPFSIAMLNYLRVMDYRNNGYIKWVSIMGILGIYNGFNIQLIMDISWIMH